MKTKLMMVLTWNSVPKALKKGFSKLFDTHKKYLYRSHVQMLSK